ncbi:hypothetical protein Bpfe_013354 [Biomphalaria pfeifferi]|uniref:Uncharacterized protein n=1 Tax=Biomphalaria pfeifferi TaxID=112525 RepID=A0AAD8FBD8_BIOPF|nr:hypothetical protein Bpfe_013354 [Biomphalaria pfeifferi]
MNYLKCYKLFTKHTSTSTSRPVINYNAYIEELPISADNKSALLLELQVFRRWIDNMKATSLQDVMMEVITGASEIFPAFSTLAVKLLVAPVGTASVERVIKTASYEFQVRGKIFLMTIFGQLYTKNGVNNQEDFWTD